jgi:hypothetical protein
VRPVDRSAGGAKVEIVPDNLKELQPAVARAPAGPPQPKGQRRTEYSANGSFTRPHRTQQFHVHVCCLGKQFMVKPHG